MTLWLVSRYSCGITVVHQFLMREQPKSRYCKYFNEKEFISSSFNRWKMDDMNHFGTDEVITEGHRVIARRRGVIGRHVGSAVALYTLMMHSRAPNTVGRLSSTGAWTSKAATATWTDGKYRMGLDRIGWWPPDGGSNIFRTTPNL